MRIRKIISNTLDFIYTLRFVGKLIKQDLKYGVEPIVEIKDNRLPNPEYFENDAINKAMLSISDSYDSCQKLLYIAQTTDDQELINKMFAVNNSSLNTELINNNNVSYDMKQLLMDRPNLDLNRIDRFTKDIQVQNFFLKMDEGEKYGKMPWNKCLFAKWNQNLDLEVQRKLASHENFYIKLYLARNPKLDISTQIMLASDTWSVTRSDLAAGNDNLDIFVQNVLAKDDDKHVRLHLARNLNIDQSVREILEKDEWSEIIKCLNDNRHMWLLVMTAKDPNIDIKTQQEILSYKYADFDRGYKDVYPCDVFLKTVKRALLNNPNIENSTREMLKNDEELNALTF
jgi:hypothetical protein